jgi:hypothetical protein
VEAAIETVGEAQGTALDAASEVMQRVRAHDNAKAV